MGKTIRIIAGLGSGLMASTLCLPFDNLKTKMQKMKVDPKTGKLPYKNIVQCGYKTVANEGIGKLWVGFPTFYARVGTHSIVALLSIDAIHSFSNQNLSDYY